MDPSNIGKFVEELFQWEPHRIGALVTGLLFGFAVALWVWRIRRGQVKELEEKNAKLEDLANKRLDRSYSLEETIDGLRKRLKELDQVKPVAIELEKKIQEIEKGDDEDVVDGNGKLASQAYWVIAPYSAEEPELFDQVWKLELKNNFISIGWSELGDISSLDKAALRSLYSRTWPNDAPGKVALACGMLWKFYHSIKIGDVIVARQGTKKIVAIGKVQRPAYYDPAKSPAALWPGEKMPFSYHIDVKWQLPPQIKVFPSAVFGLQTVFTIPDARYSYLVGSGKDA